MTEKIIFKQIPLTSTFLDPRQEFRPTSQHFQVRVDPLTGRTAHFAHFGAIKPQKLDLEKYKDPEMKGFCPFCGEFKIKGTPKYSAELVPDGRLSQGEALLVPNLFPYDVYCALAIVTDDHVVSLEELTEKRLSDAFSVGTQFLQRVKAVDPTQSYHIMTWNYMPPSGGSLVHPHQQYFATAHPGNQFTDEYRSAEAFYNRCGNNFWSELITAEIEKAERYLGRIGESHWLIPFVPTGVLGEVLAVFPEVFSIDDFTASHITDLVQGLQKLFRYFIDNNICSFNAAMFWGAADQSFFPAHLRIVPRTFLNTRDYAPDMNFFQVSLQEPLCVLFPEDLCRDVKKYFDPR